MIDFGDVSTATLSDLQFSLDSLLCTIFKVDTVTPTLALEHQMSKLITKAWESVATKTLNAELKVLMKKPFTSKNINSFVLAMGKTLSTPLTKAQIELVKGKLSQIWKEAKRLTSKPLSIKLSFSQVDKRAVAALNNHQVFWIGDFYSTHLSKRIQAVSGDVLIKQGLGRVEAGKELRSAIEKEFGLVSGGRSKYAPKVPAQFAGNSAKYFEGVASTSAHQARTFSKMTVFRQANVKFFRLINPNDKRTGTICQQMSGQEFSVKVGVSQMSKVLGAKNPKDIKKISPWLSGTELVTILDGAEKGSSKASANLSNANITLPPFHAFCRTEPVAI